MEVLSPREKRKAERHIKGIELRERVLLAGKGIGHVSLMDRIKDKFSGVGISIASPEGGYNRGFSTAESYEEARQSVEEMLENLKVNEGE